MVYVGITHFTTGFLPMCVLLVPGVFCVLNVTGTILSRSFVSSFQCQVCDELCELETWVDEPLTMTSKTRTLFFIHGWPDGPRVWDKQVHEFKRRGYKCVRVVLPRFGAQDLPENHPLCDFPVVIEMLRRALLQHASAAQPATVVAHDWGSTYAYRLQFQHPYLVERLVVCDVGAHVRWDWQSWRKVLGYQVGITAAYLLGDRWGFDTQKQALSLGASQRVMPDAGYSWRINYPYAFFHIRLLCWWFSRSGDGFPEVGAGSSTTMHIPSCPTLYMYGAQKGNPPTHFHSQAWLDNLSLAGVEPCSLPCGHWITLREPEACNVRMSAFLSSQYCDRCRITSSDADTTTMEKPADNNSKEWFGATLRCFFHLGLSAALVIAAVLNGVTPVSSSAAAAALVAVGGGIVSALLLSKRDPGIPALPLVPGSKNDMGPCAHRWKRTWAEKFGGTFGVWQKGRLQVIAGESSLMRRVLHRGNSERSSRFQECLERTLTGGVPNLFTLPENNEWKRRRKAMSKFFAAKNLRKFEKEIRGKVATCSNIIAAAEGPVDVDDLMIRLTLDVIGIVVMDLDINALGSTQASPGGIDMNGADVRQIISELINMTLLRMYEPPQTPPRQYELLWSFVRNAVTSFLRTHSYPGEKSEAETRGLYLVQCFPQVEQALREGKLLDDAELNDVSSDIIIFLVAGHETTGHTLAWTLWHVATLGDNSPTKQAINTAISKGLESQQSVELFDRILLESMRLKPASANGTGRILTRGIRVCREDGLRIFLPPKTAVNCPFYTAHMSTETWGSDAAEFKPARWRSRNMKDEENAFNFLAFSSGPRSCVGRNLALFELRLALPLLLRKFHFSPASTSSHAGPREVCGINLHADGGLWLCAQDRTGQQ